MSSVRDHRPLSPHLQVYRWQITNTLSILHRITGFGLALGLAPLALWLWSLAYAPAWLECINQCFSSILGKLALFAWTLAFYYHLGNGMRHLNWDLGRGFELSRVTASGRFVVAFALLLTIITWGIVARKVGL